MCYPQIPNNGVEFYLEINHIAHLLCVNSRIYLGQVKCFRRTKTFAKMALYLSTRDVKILVPLVIKMLSFTRVLNN